MGLSITELSIMIVGKHKLENFVIEALFAGSIIERENNLEYLRENVTDALQWHGNFDDTFYNQQITWKQFVNELQPKIDVELAVKTISKMVSDYNESNRGVVRNIKLQKIVIYNYQEDLVITTYSVDGTSEKKVNNYNNVEIFTPNHVPVKHTTIYMQIEFDVCSQFLKSRRATMEKCIEIVC